MRLFGTTGPWMSTPLWHQGRCGASSNCSSSALFSSVADRSDRGSAIPSPGTPFFRRLLAAYGHCIRAPSRAVGPAEHLSSSPSAPSRSLSSSLLSSGPSPSHFSSLGLMLSSTTIATSHFYSLELWSFYLNQSEFGIMFSGIPTITFEASIAVCQPFPVGLSTCPW